MRFAIEMMISRDPGFRSPVAAREYMATIIAAVLGVCISFAFPGRTSLVIVVGVAGVIALLGLGLLGARLGSYLFNPIVPSAALLTAMGISAALPEALRRFRA